MKSLQIDFHGVPASPAVAAFIHTAAERLTRFHDGITRCRVVVEATQRHLRRGHPYAVHITLRLPGRIIETRQAAGRRPDLPAEQPGRVTKKFETDTRHKDLYVAVHDAFDIARRRLEDYVSKPRGNSRPARRQRLAA